MRWSRVGRVALCVAAVASGVAAQADTAALVAQLGSADGQERYAAYRELQRTRPPAAVALLARQLGTFPVNGQSLGLALLQSYPADQTRDAYRRLLADGGPFVRGASAAMLFRTGDRTAADAIAAAVLEADEAERPLLLSRLYGIDDPRVRGAIRALVVPAASATDLENALYHLLTSSGSADAATADAATAVLAEPAADLRVRAACAAYLLAAGGGGVRHGPALAAAIGEDRTALTRLMRFLERTPALGDELTAALADLLATARNQVEVTYAARLLGKHARGTAAAALRKLLDAEDARIREAALKAISDLPGGLDEKTLRTMLGADDAATALVAADTLRKMDDTSGLTRVLELVRAEGPERVRAVEVLGGFRVRAAVPPLLDALEDDDEPVRRAAFQAIGRVLPDLFPYRRIDVASTGYRPDAPSAERAGAVAALRKFWSESR